MSKHNSILISMDTSTNTYHINKKMTLLTKLKMISNCQVCLKELLITWMKTQMTPICKVDLHI